VGLLIVALAIGVRVAWVFLVPTRPVGDFAMYIESARHLVEHRALDPEFIYMPGYVAVVAAVHALGGGLLAIKMIGVVAGGLAAGAVYALGRLLFGGPAAVVAGLMCALWPGGIAVASVTGTDMPAAALIVIAVWLLVRGAGARPLGAPALFGLVLGLASYIRAVALPLTVMAAPHFRARGAAFGHVVTRTLAAVVVASLVLLPWGIRNKKRYGEFFLTDSHGGNTALVGSNPNSDGTYTRSLNRLFSEGTGYKLFAPPHRESDRAAFKLATHWAKAEPKYALGLLAAKADRLLSHERPLLYWPLSALFDDTFGKDQVEKPARDLVDRLQGGWLVLIVLIVVVGAPLVEELLYRGLIFRSLEARLAAPLAVVLGWCLLHRVPDKLPGHPLGLIGKGIGLDALELRRHALQRGMPLSELSRGVDVHAVVPLHRQPAEGIGDGKPGPILGDEAVRECVYACAVVRRLGGRSS